MQPISLSYKAPQRIWTVCGPLEQLPEFAACSSLAHEFFHELPINSAWYDGKISCIQFL